MPVNFDRDLTTLFYVREEFLLTARWRLQGTLLYILGDGDQVSDFVISLA
jgi:hypothetical protein